MFYFRGDYVINEVLEIQEYLKGKNISEKHLYRICFLIAKWYKQQGLSNVEIREKIFEWGQKYKIHIKDNVNSIIYNVLNDEKPLRGNETVVKISRNDINEIIRRFDNEKVRKIALAILCYAKVSADRNGEFNISALSLSNWLKINYGNMCSRYFKEMIDFEYIQKVCGSSTFTWNKNTKSTTLRLKLLVPVENDGEFVLNGNDIDGLYNDVFKKAVKNEE